MIDIEDISGPDNTTRISDGQVSIKKFRNNERFTDPNLPGTATVFVKTWGCGHNNSDGEYMAGLLASEGYNVILEHEKALDADVWVLNSCTVKGPSQQTFTNDIERGISNGKKIVVAGCVPQASPSGEAWKDLSIIGVQQIDKVVSVVEETLKGNTVKFLRDAKELDENGKKRKAGGAPLNLPKVRRNPFIEIIPINTGCLNQCTYCKTKHARGDLGSYAPEEIYDRVKSVLDEGVVEIWLTSEDIGAYGKDINVSIVELLWGIIAILEAHPLAMLRVGMTNPPYILEYVDEMAKILAHPKVYSFIHIPVQAGSTKVLTDMRRLYTIEDFELLVDTLLKKVPEITIATDVICGFPTETDQDFEETLRVLEKYKFPAIHISQFYPRPGTPAARMKRINTLIVKQRSRKATALFESYTSYDHLLGKTLKVIATEVSADGQNFVAHDKSYRQVLVKKNEKLMGNSFEVKITSVSKWHVYGEVIESTINGSVAQKRIPQLVRVQRKVLNLKPSNEENHKNSNSGNRDDGAILSTGKETTVARPRKTVHLILLTTFSIAVFSIEHLRWSVKLLLIFLAAMYYLIR